MAKETKLTEKTQVALDGLKELGGSATFRELKDAGYEVGSANLTSLKRKELVEVVEEERERVITETVNVYKVVEQPETDSE